MTDAAKFEKLTAYAPTDWTRFVMATTAEGLRKKNMVAAYDKILADPRCIGHEREQFEEARHVTHGLRVAREHRQRKGGEA